jgi:4-oxalocrotonate tautomerase
MPKLWQVTLRKRRARKRCYAGQVLPVPTHRSSAEKKEPDQMPLTRISLRRGKPGVYQAMRETFDVPDDDRFMMIHEHDANAFTYGADYLGIARSDDLVIIQLTVSEGRSGAKKAALYKEIVARLTRDPGLRLEDVFINLIEVKPENWSFGHGLAQYARLDA